MVQDTNWLLPFSLPVGPLQLSQPMVYNKLIGLGYLLSVKIGTTLCLQCWFWSVKERVSTTPPRQIDIGAMRKYLKYGNALKTMADPSGHTP